MVNFPDRVLGEKNLKSVAQSKKFEKKPSEIYLNFDTT
jgi:hypothetical protein